MTEKLGMKPRDGLAHVAGATDRPLVEATVPAFLADVVRRHGEREAAFFRATGDRWTYARFAEKIDELAAGLLALGVGKGDRVAIWSPNRPEWLLTQFATARIGAILVNINPAYRTHELAYALNKVATSTLLLAPRFKTSDYAAMIRELAPELATCAPGALASARLPNLRNVIELSDEPGPGAFGFSQVTAMAGADAAARLDAVTAGLSPNDPINIQFTSGTTGDPKGATLTHRNIVNNGVSVARAMKLQAGEKLCIPVPFYHCFGMVLGNLAAISEGVTMVFPSEAFDPLETLRAIHDERCNGVHGVPTMFSTMLDHPKFERFDLSSLRTGIMAGAPCPEPLMRKVMERMHCREITIAYGMTETSPVSFQSSTDDPVDRRCGTVGRIQPHVECKIVGEGGRTLRVGEKGELLTRGYLVMQGYWDDPERTAEALREGWMHTGDLAIIDEEGYCRIVGRIKDMLIRGGENVYPTEVENFLLTHPDIAMAQVFGVPDEKMGEEVAAWIVPRAGATPTPEAIRDWCRGKIAHYKIPRYVKMVESFPLTATGKAQKFRMQEAMAEELGLSG